MGFLTKKQVNQLKTSYPKYSISEIAKKFNCSKTTVKYHLYPKIKDYIKKRPRTPFEKEMHSLRVKENYPKNKYKISANQAVYYAVKSGKLIPPTMLKCAKCSSRARYYHYKSYSKKHKLDVIPMCGSCHHYEHLKLYNGKK